MTSQLRLLAAACGLVLFAGIVASFTVDEDDADLASADRATSTTTPSIGEDVDDPADPDDAANTTETEETTATTAAGDTTTSTPTTSGTPTTTPSTAPTTQPSQGSTPTTPGTYTYDVDGSADGETIDGTSTLTVSQVDGEGRQTHNQKGDEGESTTIYRYATEGIYLESTTMNAQGATIRLTASSPFLIIPADATAGTVTTGQLTGDGLTADITFTLLEAGGETSKARIDAEISGRVMNTCDVDGTTTSTIVARSSDRLPIDTHDVTDMNATGGVLCPGKITSDVRSVLRA